ncbi:hypothetical protein Trco_004333 [Trichoderma cornu-damae]|uniref:Uncharacterized protein n=1 Tax=Trichoderma cornu-damae TaxID=654480 RepID=A0A9P8QMB3_9HYPO|nr:hypothetical protein Trco_004333 [Trichoderma cornu-damae]
MPTLVPHHHPQPPQSSTKSLSLLSLSLSLLPFLSLIPASHANTEKVIFTAPPPISLSSVATIPPSLNHDISVLGPSARWSLRTNLTRVFPPEQEDDERGFPSWLLLDDLTPGQRYELRVCWSALQPTAFTLDVYPLATVLSTPSLLQSFTQHAASVSSSNRQQQQGKGEEEQHQRKPPHKLLAPNGDSALLLRVLAAADYFSHHSSLMKDPPPVLVDLILDPYLHNVLPRSLVPTLCYLVVVGVVSWLVAQGVARSLASVAGSGNGGQAKKQN